MYDFTLQIFFFGSMSFIAYLFARALPRVSEHEQSPSVYEYIDRLSEKIPLHRLDERLHTFIFKTLKRLRVIVMKMDNRLMHSMDRLKKQEKNNNAPHPVRELLEQINGDIKKEE